jgi:hypothetical protein
MLGGTIPFGPCAPQYRDGVTIRSSRVGARRRHAAENPGGSAPFAEREKRNDFAKVFAVAAAAADTPVPTLSWTSSR